VAGKRHQGIVGAYTKRQTRLEETASKDFAARIQCALADGKIEPHEFEDLVDHVTHVIVQIMKSQILLFPYHASFKLMGHEIRLAQEVAKTYGLDLDETTVNFTDTLLDTNGVTRSTREMIRQAIARNIPFITVTARLPRPRKQGRNRTKS
jgi:hypothetical protein